MAIAYKSQGAGASSETSGAAVSPASPATVDAGDILIVHAYFEGTATAPSTPSGFTLLSGPHVIESTIGRHWIYGKIADGSEDGAANELGTAAVTTMRSGRCYSFSGRVAGSITDLVVGFAATSHATDPQMPTVSTTVAGGLAVACVAQNDNNALASATGESGGDWVEAVAEYTVALTPGLSLGIQTCTPTGDPGTVSGGSIATTNDPCGVIGFEIRPSVPNINVTPTEAVAASAATGPTITFGSISVEPTQAVASAAATAPVITFGALNVEPTPAIAVATAADPSIQLPIGVTPVEAIAVSAAASPAISFGALSVEPTAAIAVAAASSPTISFGSISVEPTHAAAASAATAPAITFGALDITPTAAIAASSAASPTIDIGGGAINVTPIEAIAAAAAIAAVITFGALSVTPTVAIGTATAASPNVAFSTGIIVSVPSGSPGSTVTIDIEPSAVALDKTESSSIIMLITQGSSVEV